MYRKILKGSVGSSSNVFLGLAVAAAIALGGQQASAIDFLFINKNFCDAEIPYGTTNIHVSGTVYFHNGSSPVAHGVTVVASDGMTLLGPIDLEGCHCVPGGVLGFGTNYSGTITVPVGCGPIITTVTVTGDGLTSAAQSASLTCFTTVTPALNLTENCDASIPFGTTSIHVSGTVTNL